MVEKKVREDIKDTDSHVKKLTNLRRKTNSLTYYMFIFTTWFLIYLD